MKILYHYAFTTLKGCEIREPMRLNYSLVIVSLRRKWLKKILNNISLQDLIRRIKYNLSTIKI